MDLCCIFLSYKQQEKPQIWSQTTYKLNELGVSQLFWAFCRSSLTICGDNEQYQYPPPSAGTDLTARNCILPTWKRISRKTISPSKIQLELEEDTEGFLLNPLQLKAKINPFVWQDHSADLSTTWKIYHSE